jgi:hypothetical protein
MMHAAHTTCSGAKLRLSHPSRLRSSTHACIPLVLTLLDRPREMSLVQKLQHYWEVVIQHDLEMSVHSMPQMCLNSYATHLIQKTAMYRRAAAAMLLRMPSVLSAQVPLVSGMCTPC